MDEKDKKKIAFKIIGGLYKYNVMPFGLKGVSATFQKLMVKVLGPFLWDFVIVYLDDILIFSKSYEKYLVHLEKVFQAIRNAGLKLKIEKCEFATQELKYLGFKINKDGIASDPDKVKVIVAQPASTNQTQIRAFQGMIKFFKNHI